MAFLEDPRLRQRWNQLSHNAEAVTSDAAAGIWTFQHRYINPCLASLAASVDQCTGVCLGDREDRARRLRERARGARRTRAEYSFDFYDDWNDADDEWEDADGAGGGGGGFLNGWGGEDWDRLLAGTGSARSKDGADGLAGGGVSGGGTAKSVSDQPKRKRAMSYGTKGVRRKSTEEDPTVIPSTAPLGFLERLPWKLGGTLRYKPSAANLQDNPGTTMHGHSGEREPLLGAGHGDAGHGLQTHRNLQAETSPPRKRSGTTTSRESTSDSFRSRNDLFPSDGEGDEDAIPLDDEFAVALDTVHDDRSSGRTRSSKGKRPEGSKMSRTVSRTTIGSSRSRPAIKTRTSSTSNHSIDAFVTSPDALFLSALDLEEERLRKEEDEEIERKRAAAAQLAAERGLMRDRIPTEAHTPGDTPYVLQNEDTLEPAGAMSETERPPPPGSDPNQQAENRLRGERSLGEELKKNDGGDDDDEFFVGAKLPSFR